MQSSYLHNGGPANQRSAIIPKSDFKASNGSKVLPEVHSLHTNRAVPHALESALLLGGIGPSLRALEAETLSTRPAEWRRGIAESKARTVEETESHTRRHGDYGAEVTRCWGWEEGRDRPVTGGLEFSARGCTKM